jgi:ribose transport system permease protein
MLTNHRELLVRFQSLIALALMVLAMSLLSDRFLTPENGWNILRQISVNLCLSLGMTLIILAGGIDLSVGAILALSGAVAAGLLKNGVVLPAVGSAASVHRLRGHRRRTAGRRGGGRVQRLGDHAVPSAAVCGHAGHVQHRPRADDAVDGRVSDHRFGTGLRVPRHRNLPGDAHAGVDFGALVGVFVVLTRRTRFGRYIYAVGGNERAALLTGLPVNRIKLGVYTLGGLLAGAAGLIVTARLDSAQPNAGLGYELDSIAAVVIGGTSLSGGRGSVVGTVWAA